MIAENETKTVGELIEALGEDNLMDADALEPGDEPFPVLLAGNDVLDGFHRISGYAAWADDDEDLLDESVDVIIVHDETLAGLIGNAEAPAIQALAIDLVLAILE